MKLVKVELKKLTIKCSSKIFGFCEWLVWVLSKAWFNAFVSLLLQELTAIRYGVLHMMWFLVLCSGLVRLQYIGTLVQ
jgi:hypothetical protein